MKKIILSLIVSALIIPSISFATQGTCSSHGGVNCSAGSDWDGSAICKDGWRDSSEKYSSVSKCSNYKPTCTSEQRKKLLKESGINEKREELEKLNKEYDAKTKEMEEEVSKETNTPYGTYDFINNQAAQIRRKYYSELDFIMSQMKSKLRIVEQLQEEIENDCYYLGSENILKNDIDILLKEYSYKESATELSCPAGSSLGKDNMCYCKDGYVWGKNNKCVSKNQVHQEDCINTFGTKSSWNGVTNKDGTIQCECSDGYVMSKDKKCIPMTNWCTETYGENIKPEGDHCVCDNSFYFDELLQKCVKDTTIFNNEEINYSINKEVIKEEAKWWKKVFNWFF